MSGPYTSGSTQHSFSFNTLYDEYYVCGFNGQPMFPSPIVPKWVLQNKKHETTGQYPLSWYVYTGQTSSLTMQSFTVTFYVTDNKIKMVWQAAGSQVSRDFYVFYR